MVEFKVQIEESLVETLGRKRIEDHLQRIILSIAAEDILADLKGNDLENDVEWKLARELAWGQQKKLYVS